MKAKTTRDRVPQYLKRIIAGRHPPDGSVRFTMNIGKGVLKSLRGVAAKRGVTMSALILEALKAKGVK